MAYCGQSMPSADKFMKRSSSQVNDSITPGFEEQESVEETLTALEKIVDEGGDGVGLAPRDIGLDTVEKRPVPVPRSNLAAPVEPRVPALTPHRSQRQTAGKHSNPYSLPKSVCNTMSFSPDILSQVLAGMVMYTSEKTKKYCGR